MKLRQKGKICPSYTPVVSNNVTWQVLVLSSSLKVSGCLFSFVFKDIFEAYTVTEVPGE